MLVEGGGLKLEVKEDLAHFRKSSNDFHSCKPRLNHTVCNKRALNSETWILHVKIGFSKGHITLVKKKEEEKEMKIEKKILMPGEGK